MFNEALLSLLVSLALVGIIYGTYVAVNEILRRYRLRKLNKAIREFTERQRRFEAQRNNQPWVNHTERRLHNSVR